jgi:type II secretory pathway pseudopilin PulG
MINKTSQNKNKGFTLIEVLVAIFILITAVVVPLTIGSKAFAYSNFVRDQSTASYLAQEAVEYIRLQRDNASLQYDGFNNPWEVFKSAVGNCMSDPDDSDLGGCYFNVQTSSPAITSCDGKCPSMYLDSNGYYTYVDTSGKWFLRSVETQVVGSGALERLRIDVTVLWNTNGVDERRFEIVEYLTPWQI